MLSFNLSDNLDGPLLWGYFEMFLPTFFSFPAEIEDAELQCSIVGSISPSYFWQVRFNRFACSPPTRISHYPFPTWSDTWEFWANAFSSGSSNKLVSPLSESTIWLPPVWSLSGGPGCLLRWVFSSLWSAKTDLTRKCVLTFFADFYVYGGWDGALLRSASSSSLNMSSSKYFWTEFPASSMLSRCLLGLLSSIL